MTVNIDGLYIYDEHRNPILEHVYRSRPPSAQDIISHFISHPSRPPVFHISDVSPPTTVFSLTQSNLLFICPCHADVDALAVLEFLYRVVDAFEDFLGSPLLASKIEDNYEIVAQLLNELCDNGLVCNTEINSLRESVEVSSIIGKLFTQVGLPGTSASSSQSGTLVGSIRPQPTVNSGPAIPWRRANVRHTSNELYVDIVESLSVVLAPSGRPLSARAAGSIAFTAKISGVPDLILSLSAPGGTSSSKSAGISRTMQLPTFHPCVRLARWKENPGELSFVPPDGRFMLAGYEVDLMPSPINSDDPPSPQDRIFLPATIDLHNNLGPTGTDFEARLTLNTNFPGIPSQPKPASTRPIASNPFSFGSTSSSSGSSNAPSLESVLVTIPLPPTVRNVTELKPSRGEASFNTWTKTVEWRVPTKDGASVAGTATLTGTVLGPIDSAATTTGDNAEADEVEHARSQNLLGYYDDDTAPIATHTTATSASAPKSTPNIPTNGDLLSSPSQSQSHSKRRVLATKSQSLMPRTASVSFTVRGWLPSGIRVESLLVDVKRSRGLGEGVKPFKGVKYVTVSKGGVERRAT